MSNPLPHRHSRAMLAVLGTLVAALLAGCSGSFRPLEATPARPADTRARAAQLLPPGVKDRDGWAADMQVAFSALHIEPSTSNLCAAIAVAEQESGITADPQVAGLPKIAWREIERRADKLGIPMLPIRLALKLPSPDGRSYAERLDAVRTERELSLIFEDFIDMVPMGGQLFAGFNPVRTAGPMQVSIAFAERHARLRDYPYPVATSLRREAFTRRGGMYFGIAHLLDYPAAYDSLLYRFADFNAGQYASRNAAFQKAVGTASGIRLALDGDLVIHGNTDIDRAGATERAVRTLGKTLDMDARSIRRQLETGDSEAFERSDLYAAVFRLAEKLEGRRLPRALMPEIALSGPKISRKLTTEWFARRVDTRYRRCLTRGDAAEQG